MYPRLRWLMIGLVFVATLINFIDRLTVSTLAPIIVTELKLSNQEYAAIASWFLVAYSISHALSGRLYDRIGLKRGFSFSITLWSLAAMAHATARGAGSLSLFRFLLGFGEAGNWPGAAKVTTEWFPVNERAFAMSIFNSGTALGSVMATPIIATPVIAMAGPLPRVAANTVPIRNIWKNSAPSQPAPPISRDRKSTRLNPVTLESRMPSSA